MTCPKFPFERGGSCEFAYNTEPAAPILTCIFCGRVPNEQEIQDLIDRRKQWHGAASK